MLSLEFQKDSVNENVKVSKRQNFDSLFRAPLDRISQIFKLDLDRLGGNGLHDVPTHTKIDPFLHIFRKARSENDIDLGIEPFQIHGELDSVFFGHMYIKKGNVNFRLFRNIKSAPDVTAKIYRRAPGDLLQSVLHQLKSIIFIVNR